jgi:phosphoenolpyruvate mutase
MPKIYLGMTIDILHHGHINIIENARKHGDVIIGLLTDQAIANHKRLPYLSWENRKRIVENINGVNTVVPQHEWDYAPNLLKYKPDFMIHGSDWAQGPLLPYRERAINALDSYGGKLIEIDYTEGVSSTSMNQQIQELGTTPEIRRKTLRRLISSKKICRFLEAHNPISALIVENAKINDTEGNIREFDGFWSSSLTDSTSMGKPDIEALDINTRLANIDNIFDVTTKPLIMDADTGGKLEHFQLHVKSMERLGISATIIEDKTGLKKNSLFGNDVEQSQDDIESFCAKIKAGRSARVGDDFMIIARIESLILDKGMDDALNRAFAYANAGVDGIMIHSRKKTPDEIFEFAKLFREKYTNIPLICVPTSYNIVTEEELASAGFNIVIYANHLLRAAFPAMQSVANQILTNSRSLEVDKQLMSINEILELIPGTK